MAIRRVHHFLQWVFAAFVVYLLLTRLFISWVQVFPQQFVTTAEWVTDSEVQFKHIEVQQSWLGVQVQVTGLQVKHKDYDLKFEYLDVDINSFAPLFPSIDYGSYLEIQGGIYQSKNYSLNQDSAPSSSNILEQFANLNVNISRLWKRVKLKDIIFTEVIRPGLSIQIYNLQSIKGTQLSVVSEFGVAYQNSLNYERFSFRSTFQSNVWGLIEGGNFNLISFEALKIDRVAKLLPKLWHDILPKGELLVDLQAMVKNRLLSKVVLKLNSQALHWVQNHEALPSSFGLALVWKSEYQNQPTRFRNWHFRLSHLQIDNKFIKVISPIELYFNEQQHLQFQSDFFDIKPFKLVLKSLFKTVHTDNSFDNTPELSISKLSGQFDWQALTLPKLEVFIKKITVPVTDYPGLSLQNIKVSKTSKRLIIETDKAIWLMAPEVHKKAIKIILPKQLVLTKLEDSGEWRLEKTQISIDGMKVLLEGQGILNGEVDAALNINIGTMAKLKQYLPYAMMPSDFQHWLKNALVAGEDIKGSIKIKGNLAKFPFNDGGGTFIAEADVKHTTLNFNKDWSALKNFTSHIKFTPFKIQVSTDSVNISSEAVAQQVVVDIDHLNTPDIALEIKGELDTTLDVAMGYLVESPLAEMLGLNSFIKDSKFSGRVVVKLDQIKVPLSGHVGISNSVKGSFEFKKSNIILLNKVSIKDLQGRVKFTEKHIAAKKISGMVFESKFLTKITTNHKTEQVHIKGSGEFSTQKSQPYFSSAVPWVYSVKIPLNNKATESVTASFKLLSSQATSKLPPPFDAKSLEAKDVVLEAILSNQKVEVIAELPGLVKFKSVFNKKDGYELEIFQAYLGPHNKPRSDIFGGAVSWVKGGINELNLDAWSALSKTLQSSLFLDNRSQSIEWGSSSINIKSLTLWDKEFLGINLAWKSLNRLEHLIQITSPNVSSKIKINEAIIIDLDYFLLPEEDVAKVVEMERQEVCTDSSIMGQVLPNIKFSGKNIKLGAYQLLSLSFDLEDSINRMSLSSIKAKLAGAAGRIDGNYQFEKGQGLSQLSLALKSDNVQALMGFLQFKKGFIAEKATMKAQLNWQGDLSCFSKDKVLGKVRFKLNDGVIEDIEPGFARIIGLLSIDALARRLRLDIKDVTNKGFLYDQITGVGKFKGGLFKLKQFEIKAPSASVKVFGEIDLIREQFDLKVKVSPTIESTLPTILSLVGTAHPLTALVVYSLMKIIPGEASGLITYEYLITGPWHNPKMVQKDDSALEDTTEVDEESILYFE